MHEVKTITHRAGEDEELADRMHRLHRTKQRHFRPGEDFVDLTTISGIAVRATHWPLRFYDHLFLFDGDHLAGQLTIQQVSGDDLIALDRHRVRLVYLLPQWRRRGIALEVYRWLISNGVVVQADNLQTPAAQALWSKLARTPGIVVTDEGGSCVARSD